MLASTFGGDGVDDIAPLRLSSCACTTSTPMVAAMRVLLLCHGLPPESVGGVEQHVDGLAAALAVLGCDVHVYARSSAPSRAQGDHFVEAGDNPRITRVVYRWEQVADLDGLYEVPLLDQALRLFLQQCQARGEQFDVAHVHHLTGMSTGSMAVLAEAGIATVMTLHDYWLACPRGQMFHHQEQVCERLEPQRCGECLQQTFAWWLQGRDATATAAAVHQRARRLLASAAALVLPSRRALAPFAALGIAAEHFTVVENGVDTEALAALPLPACGPGPLRLGYLGTLLPSKGLSVLVQAVQQLPAGSVELHVHGNAAPYHGDSGYLTRVFAGLRSGDRVHYHGPYQTGELGRILAGLDVICAPALWHEAFGLTVREGLAAGRPVLVSRIGGLQDAVQDGEQGLLLPPGDVGAWAAAIGRLAGDRDAVRTMAARCRGRARGFAAMARDLLGVYAAARRS